MFFLGMCKSALFSSSYIIYIYFEIKILYYIINIILYINFVYLNMKMSNKNLFKKTFLEKKSYISVCSKTFDQN